MIKDTKNIESNKGPSTQRLLRKRLQNRLMQELSLFSERLSSNRNLLLTDTTEGMNMIQINETTG